MIGESRSAPYRGAMSVGEIERELARLRMSEDGTPGVRASVLNLLSVADEESAEAITQVVHKLSEHYPARAILMISDPGEEEPNLEIGLSAFCSARCGKQVCADQITVHAEGAPANHLESLAGPLLIPDLPVFLWYPNGDIPSSPECDGLATLADRLILDSGAANDREAALRGAADLLGESGVPAVGDLQWAALSSWRSLFADLFSLPRRSIELEKIRGVEILHRETGECQALLFASWLSSALDWRPESVERTQKGRIFHFSSPSGSVAVGITPEAGEAPLSRVRLYSEELTFEVSRRGEHANACSTVRRGSELLAERTVRLGPTDAVALLGEELRLLDRDETYEAALRMAVGMLDV